MDDVILAEIRLFAGNFAPLGWALCWGQLLPINQNTALFSLIGTYYGGNGTTNFALPDFRSRIPVGLGTGPGLSDYELGQQGGSQSVTLQANNLPLHTHPVTGTVTMNGTAAAGNSDTPANAYPATVAGTDMYSSTTNNSLLGNMQYNLAMTATGNSIPVSIIQPVLTLTYIIALQGIFPSRP
jgi:microcystin-dependent protein